MTPSCTLVVRSGPSAGQEFEIDHELVLGRRDADLTIADDELSRRHAAVRPADAGVVVEDLGSLNGTFVDGVRIKGAVTLTAEATVRVGRSEMTVRVPAAAEPEPASEPQAAADPGRTRLASTLPPQPGAPAAAPDAEPTAPEPHAPAAIPQPQVTRVRQVPSAEPPAEAAPDAEPDAPAAIPQPQVTRVRQVPSAEPPAEAQPPAAIPQPEVTRVRAVVSPPTSGDEPAPKRPNPFKRLLARLRGGGGGKGAEQ
jgi:Inner membrane component of T3SS, cytoplasmic domain